MFSIMRYLSAFAAMGLLFLLNAQMPRPAYADNEIPIAAYTNYEVKHVTATFYGVTGDTTAVHPLNTWEWTRKVQNVQVVRKSSHSIYMDFDVYVDTYSFDAPTATDSYCLDGALGSTLIDNTFTIPIACDSFSIYVNTTTSEGTIITTTPDIYIRGIGW